MARKETYRHKNASRLSLDTTPKEAIHISPELKQQYEEGKMLLIDKALHWTSYDIVRKIRGMLRIKKVGHAGTLDPLATGLLIVCTGKFTKKINEFMAAQKEYTGSFILGAVTPTYDLESEPIEQKDPAFVTKDLLESTVKQFIGNIEQFPPAYSAIKKDGVALYELARRGDVVHTDPRKVTIHEFVITNIEMPVVWFRVTCTTGTYIRSIANDLGSALGCGAYLASLRRTMIGEYPVSAAITIEEFTENLKTPD